MPMNSKKTFKQPQRKQLQQMSQQNLKDQSMDCRICLQPLEKAEKKKYCVCKGSTSPVHYECLLKWAKHSIIITTASNMYLHCQICRARIYFDSKLQFSVNNCQEIKAEMCHRSFGCACFVLGLMAVCAAIVVSLGLLLIYRPDPTPSSRLLSVASITVLGIIFLVSLLVFMKLYCIRFDYAICGVRQYKEEFDLIGTDYSVNDNHDL